MNDNDLHFEVALAIYERYLEVIPIATKAQSKLADDIYYYLIDEQKKCDLYKDTTKKINQVPKPENFIHKVIDDYKEGE